MRKIFCAAKSTLHLWYRVWNLTSNMGEFVRTVRTYKYFRKKLGFGRRSSLAIIIETFLSEDNFSGKTLCKPKEIKHHVLDYDEKYMAWNRVQLTPDDLVLGKSKVESQPD